MISFVTPFLFTRPVHVMPGSTLTVSHNGLPVMEIQAAFEATWTHSILFRFNDQWQWLLGTEATVFWLQSQETQRHETQPTS